MRKRHLLKKAGTSLIAAALMLSCTASAYAQEKESGAAEDADGSVNARVNLNILNSKTFLLPQTGGTGLYAATIIGAIAIGLGFVLTRKKRQQA